MIMLPQDVGGDLLSTQNIITAVLGLTSSLLGYLVKSFKDRIKDKDRELDNRDKRITKLEIEVDKQKAGKENAEQLVALLKMTQR